MATVTTEDWPKAEGKKKKTSALKKVAVNEKAKGDDADDSSRFPTFIICLKVLTRDSHCFNRR